MIVYTFLKSPNATANSIMKKKYLQNFLKLDLYSRKTKNLLQNFFEKIVQSAFTFVQDFLKSYKKLKSNDQKWV